MTRIWRTRLLVAGLFAAAAFLLFIGMPAAIDRDAPDAAASVQAAEEDADDIEAALAIEQSKQDAMQAIQYQLSSPFADFTEAYETTIRERLAFQRTDFPNPNVPPPTAFLSASPKVRQSPTYLFRFPWSVTVSARSMPPRPRVPWSST